MTPGERRAAASLSAIYGLRMLGLFLILPVFAVYASQLPGGSSHTMVGIALGAYGLTQACLQLPFGILSDRYGRKRLIYVGLTIFAIGSVIAALAQTVEGIAIGRAVQGAGAISAAIMALLADLTEESHRTQAFAMVGSTIGLTFGVSMVMGPALYHSIGVPGMFWLTAILAVCGILVVARATPSPAVSRFHSEAEVSTSRLATVLKNPELLRLNFGIFSLHSAQMAMFVVIPLTLKRVYNPDVAQHWKIYLPVMVISFALAVPFIIYGEKKNKLKPVFVGAIALLLLAQLEYAMAASTTSGIVLYLMLFYMAFNALEASLPSLISKIAPVSAKGTAIGVYNTCQSLGLFIGSAAGGILSQRVGPHAVFWFSGAVIFVWLLLAVSMRVPPAARTRMFAAPGVNEQEAAHMTQALMQVAGVLEAAVAVVDGVAYLKVRRDGFDEAAVLSILGQHRATGGLELVSDQMSQAG